MSRVIKFRKWDFEEKEMIDGDSLAFEEYAPITHLLSQDGIMQWTGLADIYEGDILRVNKLIFESSSPLPENLTVKYYGGMFQLFRGNEILMGLHLEYLDDYEIIGNIWENPELMKANHEE